MLHYAKMIKIDQVDLQIISMFKSLKDEEKITTCDIAKKVFDINNNYELRIKTTLIQNRLTKLADYGVITIEKKGKTVYFINEKLCHKALILNLNGKWHTFQL